MQENVWRESKNHSGLGPLYVRYAIDNDYCICHRVSSSPTWRWNSGILQIRPYCESRIVVPLSELGDVSTREKALQYCDSHKLKEKSTLPGWGNLVNGNLFSDKSWYTSNTVIGYAQNTELDPRSRNFEQALDKLKKSERLVNELKKLLNTEFCIGGYSIQMEYLSIYQELGI